MTSEERARLTLERWWVADRSWDEMTRKVAAAITAAVEEERKRWVRAVLDRDKLNDDWVKGLKLEAEEAALAAVEKREKELIPLVCPFCGCGSTAKRVPDGEHFRAAWWHWDNASERHATRCPASPLHESIHQSGRKLREGRG